MGHDIDQLEIKPGKVQIRGIVDTIAARDEVIGRLEDDEVLLDLRSVRPEQDSALEAAVLEAHSTPSVRQDSGR